MIEVDKCSITRYPTPVLAQKAKPVEQFDDNLRALAEKMKDIMVEHKGVGLAGPQAGVGLRIFVASPDGTKENAKVYIKNLPKRVRDFLRGFFSTNTTILTGHL